MTKEISEKIKDWQEITQKVNLLRSNYVLDEETKRTQVREVEELIKSYATNYQCSYDPINPPGRFE